MSLVINTNSAATAASNNLAASNVALQRSLNRLSSGSKIVSPADDAGGLAVSMKLSAAARRQGAAITNVANSTSFLQTQDGALKVAGRVLDRISELKTLSVDPTKSSSDVANYNVEFEALQDQLTSIAGETFNGVNLFGSSTFNVATSDDGNQTVAVGGIDLLGSPTTTNLSFTDGIINGPDYITFNPPGAGTLTVTSGGIFINGGGGNHAWMDQVGDTATYDGAGGWTFSGAGITTGGSMASGITSVGMEGSQNVAFLGTATFTAGGSSNTSDVASATDLSSLSLDTITDAIQDLATHRATNGAQQSRLGFASELLTTNKTNLEAANSRIVDVDVATESTMLARQNILVQSGTAMLSQANQSNQGILRLLG